MRQPLILLAMLGMVTVTSQVQAAPIQFSGVVPGTVVTKGVQSIRERRFEHLIEQETDFSCGAASLATILKYAYGWTDITEETVLAGLMEVADRERVRELGFSLLDLNNYAQSIGLRGRGYEIGPESLEEISIPVIVLLNLDGYEHFVVMKKARGDRVYIGDPALGNKVMDREEFLDSWNNIIFAVVGDGFDTSTVLLDPAQPLTARRMTDVFSPVPEQQLLDFGFKHSEVF
ncbi:C39 family peptidase [Billgrantia lactosivorans]|uniref:C39 family peptidase n=1 Tax=Billgrantia lactosivorans TaxID=2185141 RepID=UPI000DAC8D4A|nr:C39 family peptidase [Halomonas lactosivorans]